MKQLITISITVLALVLVATPFSAMAAPQCASFELMPAPAPSSANSALASVAAVGDGTAWAVGNQGSSAIILHFDGSQWIEVPMPQEAEGIFFSAAGNTPEGDVWLIGTRSYSVYQVEVFLLRCRGGVIDRVDSLYNGGAPVHISATSNDNVWAVSGRLWPSDQGGYALHFDGSQWTTMQMPAEYNYRQQALSIYSAAVDDVWVVGEAGDSRADYRSYVQHWDGSSWELVPTPFQNDQLVFFTSIAGSSSSDIWVTGHINFSQDLLMHWDGSSWTVYDGPVDQPLDFLVVPAAGNSWAAPYSQAPGSPFFYWDGAQWTDGGTVDVPGAVTVNWKGMSQAGGCDVWVVGSYHDGAQHHAVAARLPADGGNVSGVGDAPRAAVLLGNYPNPFNPSTLISFELATRQHAELSVYTVDGRRVTTLMSGQLDAGAHRVMWDGRDTGGRAVPSGLYLYRLDHEGGALVGKMALTK